MREAFPPGGESGGRQLDPDVHHAPEPRSAKSTVGLPQQSEKEGGVMRTTVAWMTAAAALGLLGGASRAVALDCTLKIGQSCASRGAESAFAVHADFPLDNRSHLRFTNRGATECRLQAYPPSTAWRAWSDMIIPAHGTMTSYNPGFYNLKLERSSGACTLEIEALQDPPGPPRGRPVRVHIVTSDCNPALTKYCGGTRAPVKVTDSYPDPMWTDEHGMLFFDHGIAGSGLNAYLDFAGLHQHGYASCGAHIPSSVKDGATVTLGCTKPTTTITCPRGGHFAYGQEIGDGWRIWTQNGKEATVGSWTGASAHPTGGNESVVECTHGNSGNIVSAQKKFPGRLDCHALPRLPNAEPLKMDCSTLD